MKAIGDHRTELVRALNLLPYFRAHPQRSLFEAARDLGRSPKEIMADLDRLFVCGRPGLMPDDLVDLRRDYRRVEVLDSQGLDKALRLTASEAAALLLTLESLEHVPGLADDAAIRSAADKLRGLTGRTTRGVVDAASTEGEADSGEDVEKTKVQRIREAIADHRLLEFQYRSASSDTLRRRTVLAQLIFSHEDGTYLRAFEELPAVGASHKNRGDRPRLEEYPRSFRLDRMSDLRVLDRTAPAPTSRETEPVNAADPFRLSRTAHKASVRVHEDLAWLADSAPLQLGKKTGEFYHGTLSYGSTDWLIRFALSHLDGLEVTGPRELVERVDARRTAALAAYEQAP